MGEKEYRRSWSRKSISLAERQELRERAVDQVPGPRGLEGHPFWCQNSTTGIGGAWVRALQPLPALIREPALLSGT